MTQSAQEIFQRYKTKQYEPSLRGVRGTYLFDIEQVGNWHLLVDDGAITFTADKYDPDCVIRCDERDFIDLIEGRRNLLTAVLQGRIQVHGDITLAQKFHRFVGAAIQRRQGAA